MEIGVGLTAAATPVALGWLQRAYVELYPSLPHSLSAMTFARFLIAFAVLIVPTSLMGATLPLVIKSSDTHEGHLGRHIGLLYGGNTAGAIVGTMAAGLYLIPAFGIQRTFYVAAALNLFVGAAALALGAAAPRGSVPATVPVARAARRADAPLRLGRAQLALILAVFAVSGFVALAAEVVWFRTLTLFLRPTVYGFAVMLATILAGIAIGSWAVTPFLDRPGRWLARLAVLELAIGVALVLSFAPLVRLPAFWAWLYPTLSTLVPEYLVYPIAGSLLAIFPTMLLMGVAFPIGLRLWTDGGIQGRVVGAMRVGTFYSLNVAGSIAGSLVAGFVLLPRLGSRTSIWILGAMAFGSGLLLLAVSEWRRPTRVLLGMAASATFVVGLMRASDPFEQFVAQRYPRQQVIWREEGVESTVVVHERTGGERTLTVNGNHQASTGSVMVRGHRNIGHLPMALHPFARDALVIGLGGGATAGAISIHAGVEVDVVELSGAVARGAQFFSEANSGLLSRSNARLHIDDGRNYLMLTPRRYDVVTADVILPIYAGSGNLYSAEYFALFKRVLKPGGMVVQWAAGTDAEYKSIVRTFLSVFPEATAWLDGTLLVGTVEPLRLRRRDFESKLEIPGRVEALRDFGVTSFDQLLTLFRAGPDQLRAFVGPGPLLTDDRPLAEYFLSLPRDRDADLSPLTGEVGLLLAPD
jgi:spermidine synthase